MVLPHITLFCKYCSTNGYESGRTSSECKSSMVVVVSMSIKITSQHSKVHARKMQDKDSDDDNGTLSVDNGDTNMTMTRRGVVDCIINVVVIVLARTSDCSIIFVCTLLFVPLTSSETNLFELFSTIDSRP